MTNRFPLILDEVTGRLKELPVGDSLDLTGSGIVAAASLEVNGEANVDKLTIGTQTINPSGTAGASNNAPLATVAFTGDFNDLANLPNSGFSGSYNDLSDTPVIPSTTKDLNDVSLDNPENNQALIWNSVANEYQPKDVVLNLDLSTTSIRDLFDVSYTLAPDTNSVLKYFADAWRPSKIQYTEIQNRPTAVSAFANDLNYVTQQDLESGIEITPTGDLTGSVFGDDSTLLVDAVANKIIGEIESDSVNINSNAGDIDLNSPSNIILTANNINTSGNIIPGEADTYDLGSPEKPFRSLYLSDNTLILGNYSLGINNGKLKLTNPGVDSGAEGLEVEVMSAEIVDVRQDLNVDNNATMRLGSYIEFEEIEQFGTDIGKLGTFADSFIGFTQAGDMILYTGEEVPASSIGDPGTPIGAIAIDSNYIYYCVAEYDGVTDIWRRTPWAESSW